MGELRGIKRDLWEGGHRTPFIVSWPGKVAAGEATDRLVSQTDIFATLADYLGITYSDDAAEDSFSFLDELIEGHTVKERRDMAIYHSAGNKLAIRHGDWVLVDDPTGDNGSQEPEWFRKTRGVTAHNEPCELFNLAEDLQETTNRYATSPEVAERLKQMLTQSIEENRTAPQQSSIQGR